MKKCHNGYVELRWLFESYMLRCFPQKGCFLLGKNIGGCSEGAQNSIKWIAESENSSVEWFRNPVDSPVEVGSLSSLYIYQGFRRIPDSQVVRTRRGFPFAINVVCCCLVQVSRPVLPAMSQPRANGTSGAIFCLAKMVILGGSSQLVRITPPFFGAFRRPFGFGECCPRLGDKQPTNHGEISPLNGADCPPSMAFLLSFVEVGCLGIKWLTPEAVKKHSCSGQTCTLGTQVYSPWPQDLWASSVG